jgi:hypothetical protein
MNDQGERFTAVVHLPEKFFSFDLITPSDLFTTSATAELNLAQGEAKRLLMDGSRLAPAFVRPYQFHCPSPSHRRYGTFPVLVIQSVLNPNQVNDFG